MSNQFALSTASRSHSHTIPEGLLTTPPSRKSPHFNLLPHTILRHPVITLPSPRCIFPSHKTYSYAPPHSPILFLNSSPTHMPTVPFQKPPVLPRIPCPLHTQTPTSATFLTKQQHQHALAPTPINHPSP